jgi:hypothetical protein
MAVRPVWFALAATLAWASPATAQEAPSIRGSVQGELARGGRANFSVTATHPDGWQAINRVAVVLELHGSVLEEVAYDVDDTTLQVGESRGVAGTGDFISGRFLRVGAFGVEVTTGGDRLRLAFGARILEQLPQEGRFRFVAEDFAGTEFSRTIAAAVEEDEGGSSLATVLAAIGVALLAGGFLGSRLTSHRREVPSVYGTVARRLREHERPPPATRR